jgi:rhodanese-related sulfurtransferase
MSMPKTIDRLLAEARLRLSRVDPRHAAAILSAGGLLVDIRPAEQRRREGEIPGAHIIERNVLEWRLDPASESRLPEIRGYEQEIVVICSEGYASSLAAAVLQDLGLKRATDLAGGFWAWKASGLPTRGPS